MAKIPGTEETIELMVNCKTYPSISTKYTETVCTGGVTADGQFIRLYPIPYRFLKEEEKYDRWDIIRVKVFLDDKDPRPESRHLAPGTPIEVIGKVTTPRQKWDWMKRVVHDSTKAMDDRGVTNGCVRVDPIEFYWEPDPVEWTEGQKYVILQRDLYMTNAQQRSMAERVPWQFRLKYRESISGREGDGKVLAWSYYRAFMRFRKTKTDEAAMDEVANKVRGSIFGKKKAVFAIFGTHSRFGTWMISALYHLEEKIIIKDEGHRGLF